MNIYQLRVSIIGIPKLYRVIQATGNCTFDDLHRTIFKAFDRFDAHLYSFYITKKDTQSIGIIYDSPEITHPMNVEDYFFGEKKKLSASKIRLDDIDLNEKDIFHYLFDFGDDWWHRIRVNSIEVTNNNAKQIQIIKSVGKSPEQYPEYDEDDYDDEY